MSFIDESSVRVLFLILQLPKGRRGFASGSKL
jgi:hypothetical protein